MFDMSCYMATENKFDSDSCECLADCTSIGYDVEISQVPSQFFEDTYNSVPASE